VGLVLGDLAAEQRRAVHAAERLEHAGLIADGDVHRYADLGGFGLGGRDHPVGQVAAHARLLEHVSHGCSFEGGGGSVSAKRSSSLRISAAPMKSRKESKPSIDGRRSFGVPLVLISASTDRIALVAVSRTLSGKMT